MSQAQIYVRDFFIDVKGRGEKHGLKGPNGGKIILAHERRRDETRGGDILALSIVESMGAETEEDSRGE